MYPIFTFQYEQIKTQIRYSVPTLLRDLHSNMGGLKPEFAPIVDKFQVFTFQYGRIKVGALSSNRHPVCHLHSNMDKLKLTSPFCLTIA